MPVMSRSLKRIVPRVGGRNAVSRLKQVVLPAPFGPMSAWIVPARTLSDTSSTATKPPNSRVKCLVSRMVSFTPDVSFNKVPCAVADCISLPGAQDCRPFEARGHQHAIAQSVVLTWRFRTQNDQGDRLDRRRCDPRS